MDTSEKIYNLQNLIKTTGIDVKVAIERTGSRRAYFSELNAFENNVRDLTSTLTQQKPKDDLLNDLVSLHDHLIKINDTAFALSLEDLIDKIKNNENKDSVSGILFDIKNNITNLCQKITEAEFSYPGLETVLRTANPVAAAKPEDGEKSLRAKMRIQPALFSNLLELVDKFEYDMAIHEVKILQTYSYDAKVDHLLEGIANSLDTFDHAHASTQAKELLTYASSKDTAAGEMTEKKKILAVDDMPDVLNTVKALLKNDYHVYCVTNHLAALKFLASNSPDLILLDIEMPDMDGFELIKIIRQMELCKNTPVLYLTGNVSVESIKTSIEAGGDDFIKKPVSYDTLMTKIAKHITKPRP